MRFAAKKMRLGAKKMRFTAKKMRLSAKSCFRNRRICEDFGMKNFPNTLIL